MEIDFNKYYDDEIDNSAKYDGFIGPKGEYYRVKKRNDKNLNFGHNEWAESYIKKYNLYSNFFINQTYSALLALSKVNGPAESLIHLFGFVYYSHDLLFHKPIIISPNESLAGHKINDYQKDMLYKIMKKNNEKKYFYGFLEDESKEKRF